MKKIVVLVKKTDNCVCSIGKSCCCFDGYDVLIIDFGKKAILAYPILKDQRKASSSIPEVVILYFKMVLKTGIILEKHQAILEMILCLQI